MHVDYNKETLVSTTSSTTDEGSRMQTLKRSVNNDEQGKFKEVGPLYSTKSIYFYTARIACIHVSTLYSNFHGVLIFAIYFHG